MSYRVHIDAYQGPFDLLLRLVSRQRVDVHAISIAQIADQYLAEVQRMRKLDLDVASDFLVVAASLLQIKAASLIPDEDAEEVALDPEFDDLTPDQTRDILVERLVNYKMFKNAAAALGARMENESRMHPREAGIDPEFLGLMPDYLQGVTLHGLAVICADIAARRDVFLLEAEHIAAVPISMERHVEGIYRMMRRRKSRTFSQLVGENPSAELVVVSFLAVLELYKRGVVSVRQDHAFDEIDITIDPAAPEITDFSVPDWGMPEDPTLEEGAGEDADAAVSPRADGAPASAGPAGAQDAEQEA